MTVAADRTGKGTRLNLLGDPLKEELEASQKPGAFMEALSKVWSAARKQFDQGLQAQVRSEIASVPEPVQQLAAFWLLAELRARAWQQRALRRVPQDVVNEAYRVLTAAEDVSPTADALERLRDTLDMPRLLVGGELLAFAAEHARRLAEKVEIGGQFVCTIPTPLGVVRLAGSGNDTHAAKDGPYLLIIDVAGNDTYGGGGGNTSADQAVSVIMDLRGNDTYAQESLNSSSVAEFTRRKTEMRSPLFGGGVLGYGLLLDLQGNDVYRSLGNSQGAGWFGTGLLADLAGDDRYDCYERSQGAGYAGVGLLVDADGSDEYRCFFTSQGYGGTLGSGLLADYGTRNDLYEANDTVIDQPSPQTAEHNASLSQGFGYGLRADYTDGHSLAGGIGMLMDEGGDNTFRCGVFGQGAGYWYGLGVLLTGSGNDTYEGVWYVQASAAHFAVGVLADEGGQDVYRASMNMAQGAGHDFSVGFLIDRLGNDRYEAPNLSLGGGNANGMGFFWDVAGDDTYVVRPSITLGRGNNPGTEGTLRGRNLTLGLFLDTGGNDQYPAEISAAKNNTLWSMTEPGSKGGPNRGAGLDVEAPATPDPT